MGRAKGAGSFSSPAPRMPCRGSAIHGYRAEQPAVVGGTDAVTVTSWRPTPAILPTVRHPAAIAVHGL